MKADTKLRDEFAKVALQGMLANDRLMEFAMGNMAKDEGLSEHTVAIRAARSAYLYADAMLQERDR